MWRSLETSKARASVVVFFHVTDVTVANLAIKDISISDVGFFSFCSGSTQIRGSYFVPC